MMPCFNSASTVRHALGSLLTQSVDDWEVICVDDGSTDDTAAILELAAKRDRRIRVERFTENRGRGAARQRALELATGKYLAFCDSDDWMYPQRLACEVRWMQADPHIAAVSVCGAITDERGDLIGVLRPRDGLPSVARFTEPVPPPLIFPSSMILNELAQRTGFDPAFRRSQDSDFLMRALLGRHYAISSEVLYGYSQGAAASLDRTLEGYRYRVRAHLRHAGKYPLRVARTVVETGAKMAVYRAAGTLGVADKLIQRRWSPQIDAKIAHEFEAARTAVNVATSQLFDR
jgi:glycosyltransferase involved in cell wall biosynthesis